MSTPFYDLASLVVVPSGYKASKVYAQKPLTTDGQLTFSRASTATRVNASGLIETVASNVPRLDYTNSTCPKLLLEPSRTNVMLHSNDAGSWNSSKSGTLTANAAISPDGTQNAFSQVATDSDPYAYQGLTLSAGTYTYSCYLKGVGTAIGKNFSLRIGVNTQNLTIPSAWTRFTYSVSVSAGSYNVGFEAPESAAVGDTIYGYGFQLEAGAYPTSLIPTTTAAVTRLADAASKTGISSLIGQTEGTLFVDFTLNGLADYGTPISVNDGTTTQYIWLTIFANGNLRAELYNGAAQASISYSGAVAGGRYKMAFGYKANDFALYVNGALVGTDLTGTTFSGTTMSRVDTNLTNAAVYSTASESINQSLLFTTRLTNAQLAELTTI